MGEQEIAAMLRGMVKSRTELVALYRQGNRPDLVAKEEAEIAVIEKLPAAAVGRRGDDRGRRCRDRRDRRRLAEGDGPRDGGAEGAAWEPRLDSSRAGRW